MALTHLVIHAAYSKYDHFIMLFAFLLLDLAMKISKGQISFL